MRISLYRTINEAPDYMVSEHGVVVRKRDFKVVKWGYSVDGYPKVKLRLGVNSRICRLVHRLVALSFVDGYAPGLDVNHIDGNKLNTHPSNLEWVTRRENILHAYRIGLKSNRGSKHPCSVITEEDVPVIRQMRASGMTLKSIGEKYGVTHDAIWRLVNNKTWSHV